ncbi:hypothetical protein MGG_16484 [Pyricularia oryzae 70-15]|uniref:Uncharacterized protein n=2 Tax=Pyricularia oryzae TaxID=318829 RepID=G4MQF5_PYRO7|nr:uncharacterized protein MGG_16484 [Pyricularia oryzae 70-15]EHA58141.1 hypothetical protein MGG_16484 [Pyricularia oryzae 70-15]
MDALTDYQIMVAVLRKCKVLWQAITTAVEHSKCRWDKWLKSVINYSERLFVCSPILPAWAL